MNKLFKAITTLYLIMSYSLSSGQGDVDSIKNYCKLLNQLSISPSNKLIKIDLGMGAVLHGYFIADSLIHIHWFNAHTSLWQNDFYYKDGYIVLARYRKRRPMLEGQEMEVLFDDTYYFDQKKVIKKEFIGSRSKKVRKEIQNDILKEALQYRDMLLSEKMKKE